MFVSATLYLFMVSAVCDGFFFGSYRKQPDCPHRGPHAAPWHLPPTTTTSSIPVTTASLIKSNINSNNNVNAGINAGSQAYGSYKDYGSHHQQPQTVQPLQPVHVQHSQQQQSSQSSQQKQQQIQHQSQVPQQPQMYTSQHPTAQTSAKYDSAAYQYNQQFSYDSGYGSYPQNVQLIPCLCPVNKEIIEQQQLQQQNLPHPLFVPPSYIGEGDISSQTDSKKNS